MPTPGARHPTLEEIRQEGSARTQNDLRRRDLREGTTGDRDAGRGLRLSQGGNRTHEGEENKHRSRDAHLRVRPSADSRRFVSRDIFFPVAVRGASYI